MTLTFESHKFKKSILCNSLFRFPVFYIKMLYCCKQTNTSEMNKWQISLGMLSRNGDLCYESFNETFHAFHLANMCFFKFLFNAANIADSSTGACVNIMICSRIANLKKLSLTKRNELEKAPVLEKRLTEKWKKTRAGVLKSKLGCNSKIQSRTFTVIFM